MLDKGGQRCSVALHMRVRVMQRTLLHKKKSALTKWERRERTKSKTQQNELILAYTVTCVTCGNILSISLPPLPSTPDSVASPARNCVLNGLPA